MRKLFYLFPILLGAILSSCYDDEINDIKNRLDTIEGTHIASLQEQVAAIKSTLPQLEKADKELKGYIESLQTTASNLQKAIEQTNNEIENVESELKSSISTTKSEILDQLSLLKEDMEAELAQINSAITTLQQKDTELDESISNLKDYTDTELANNKDWVNATFATLEQYKVLTDDIAIIKAQIEALNKSIADLESRINEKIETEIAAAIDLLESAIQESVTDITKAYKTAISTAKDEITEAYATAIESAIAALETSMQSWVAEQLKGYYTIAEVEAKLAVLQNEVAENDELLQEEIDALSEALAKTKEDITEAYEKAIEEAITKNNGAITDKIAEEISVVNKRIDSEVAALNAKITTLQSQIDKNSADIAKLLARIQSVSYIPAYSDGKATVKYSNIRSQVTFDFEISPKDAVVELAKVWKEALNVKATYTETRAVSFVDLPITQFEADIDNGIISIVASGENLSDEFFAGTQSASARLAISDGNNSVTSDYIPLEALEIKPESNQIWYTNGSTTEPTTSPYYITNFGANIVSNQYDTEKGHWVITFDNDITEIGPWVFEKCWSLTSITIPDSVTSISAYAFRYCSNLTSVNIPDSVTTIGWSAFTGCSSLASITIPGSVTTIDWAAFSGCSSLVSITIFDGVKSIGRSAFERCSSLTSITIPDSVTSIGRDAFFGCSSLTSITIPDSVTSIGERAFLDCSSLTSIYGKYASNDNRCLIIDGVLNSFACKGLTTYTIPDSVTSIGSRAFLHCSSLTSITIPESVTSIGELAFHSCSSLTSITIPDSVTSIGNGAFYVCSSLISVNIPNSVVVIGDAAFERCQNLRSFQGKFASDDNRCLIVDGVLNSFAPNGLTSYTIPSNVTSIGNEAFDGCSSLTSITIPDSVTSIGSYAFYDCSSLISVYCKVITPPDGGSSMFNNNAVERKIYVPAESVDAYKTANRWKDYADNIVGYDFE